MNERRPDRTERWYRRLLRLLPGDFRGDFGEEMTAVFRDEHADASRRGRAELRRLWWRTAAGVLRTAPRQHWDEIRQDTRYALRLMRRQPGFSVVAVLTIALGIGANVAVFGFIDALLLRPPAAPGASGLVRVYATTEERPFDVVSYPDYRELRDRNTVFSGLVLHRDVDVSAGSGDEPETILGELVSGNYFSTLEVRPALGRLIGPDDDRPGTAAVAVISHRLWVRRFGGDPSALGRTITLNGSAFTVAGVAPVWFRGTHDARVRDVWMPVAQQEQVRHLGRSTETPDWSWLWMSARLRPGVTLEQARTQVTQIAGQIAVERGRELRGPGFVIHPAATLPEDQRQGLVPVLGFAMAVTALVLLFACANIAGVLQARLAARRRELAIRQTLGARRGRLVRQWLTESLIVATAGGLAGALAARWSTSILSALPWPGGESLASGPSFDLRVVAFGVGLIALTALLFGLLPAVGVGRAPLLGALTDEAQTGVGGRRRTRGRRVLVALQVAVSLVLLVVAGLLTRSLQRSLTFDPGFRSDRLALVSINLRRQGYSNADARAFQLRLMAEVAATPGVTAVTSGVVVPLGFSEEVRGFVIDGRRPPEGRDGFSIDANAVGAGYFSAMGIPLVAGREFVEADVAAGAPSVAVVNETMARRFWPGENPIGREIGMTGTPIKLQIVGVARDIKYYALSESPRPYVYAPLRPQDLADTQTTLHIRTSGDPQSMLPVVRARIRAIDPRVAAEVRTFDALRREPLFPGRAMAATSGIFGLLVLVLSAVGLYGAIATSVAGRTHEIGLRLALGARRGQVFAAIVGEALAVAAAGLVLGAAVAAGAADALRGQLFGVAPSDPLTYAAAVACIAAVAVLAAFVPARRAARVDPVVALKHL